MDNARQLTGFSVNEIDPPAVVLESEIKRQALTEVSQRFSIRNDLDQTPLNVVVVSKSCGCIGMALDDSSINVDQSFVVESGQSRQISLTIPMPALGVRDTKNAMLRFSRLGKLSTEQAAIARAHVYRDLNVHPKRIELLRAPNAPASSATVNIEWTHSRGGESIIPVAVVPQSLEGHVNVTIESAGQSVRVGADLQTDYFQMFVWDGQGKSGTSPDEHSLIRFTIPNRNLEERIAVHFVEGRALLTAKEVIFGCTPLGTVTKRAFVVRAADSQPTGSIITSSSGSGNFHSRTEKEFGAGRLLMVAEFHAETVGEFQGELTLTPADGLHTSARVRYEVEVIP